MKEIVTVMLVALGLLGCQPEKVRLVWDKPTPPTWEVKPLDGFAISPAQAYEAVEKKHWALSRKHIWHLYADDRNYYVIDSFLGSSRRIARRNGVVVDGQTGEIVERSPNKGIERD